MKKTSLQYVNTISNDGDQSDSDGGDIKEQFDKLSASTGANSTMWPVLNVLAILSISILVAAFIFRKTLSNVCSPLYIKIMGVFGKAPNNVTNVGVTNVMRYISPYYNVLVFFLIFSVILWVLDWYKNATRNKDV